MKMLKELTLDQLLDIQAEHFCDNFEAGKHEDAYSNHVNRHVVWAMQRKHGSAFLGRICLPKKTFAVAIREWEGERITAFDADFAIPVMDWPLADLILEWNESGDVSKLLEIHTMIDQLGGVLLHWFGEPQAEKPEEPDQPEFQVS
jgi:hypothetical protein